VEAFSAVCNICSATSQYRLGWIAACIFVYNIEVVLNPTDMKECLIQRYEDVVARNRLYDWARTCPQALEEIGFGVQPAYAFWHSLEGCDTLPECAVTGLMSAAMLGQLKVCLLTYLQFRNVPSCVEVIDAREAMPQETFEAHLAAGRSVTLLADNIRLRALVTSKFEHVWFWDCDTHVFTDLRRIGGQPDSFNHVVASMERPPSSVGRTSKEFEIQAVKNFAGFPRDKAVSHAYMNASASSQ
jgi:hypothetical protein